MNLITGVLFVVVVRLSIAFACNQYTAISGLCNNIDTSHSTKSAEFLEKANTIFREQVESFETTVKRQSIVSPYLIRKFWEDCQRIKEKLVDELNIEAPCLDAPTTDSKLLKYYETIRQSASAIFIYLPLKCTQNEIDADQMHRKEGNSTHLREFIKPIIRSTENLHEKSFKYLKMEPVKNPMIEQLNHGDVTKFIIEKIAEQANIVAEDAIPLNAESYEPDMCREIEIDIKSGDGSESIIRAIKSTFAEEKEKFLHEYFVDLKEAHASDGFTFTFGKLMENGRLKVGTDFDSAAKELEELVRPRNEAAIKEGCPKVMQKLESSKRELEKIFADAALHVDVNCVDVLEFKPWFFNIIMEKCKREFNSRIMAFDGAVPGLETIRKNIAGSEYVDKFCDTNGLDLYSERCLRFVVSRLNSEMSEAIRQHREVRPKAWIKLCGNVSESTIRTMIIQFEALFIPYLPLSSEPTQMPEGPSTPINKLYLKVIAKVQETIEKIKTDMQSDKECHQRVATVLTSMQKAISKIREYFRESFSYFPFVFECELDDQIDIGKLTQRFNNEFLLIIGKLTNKSGAYNIPHHLIPGAYSATSAIQIVKGEKTKLLKEVSGWANNDHREYTHLLNRIMKILMRQARFISEIAGPVSDDDSCNLPSHVFPSVRSKPTIHPKYTWDPPPLVQKATELIKGIIDRNLSKCTQEALVQIGGLPSECIDLDIQSMLKDFIYKPGKDILGLTKHIWMRDTKQLRHRCDEFLAKGVPELLDDWLISLDGWLMFEPMAPNGRVILSSEKSFMVNFGMLREEIVETNQERTDGVIWRINNIEAAKFVGKIGGEGTDTPVRTHQYNLAATAEYLIQHIPEELSKLVSIAERNRNNFDDYNWFMQIYKPWAIELAAHVIGIRKIMKRNIQQNACLPWLVEFTDNFVAPIRAAFLNRFKREQQIRLKTLKNNSRRQKASVAIDRYIRSKEKWMERNLYLQNPSGEIEVVRSKRRDSFHLFFEFLSKWKLSDVTADINRICQVARLPTASFHNIPVAFETDGLFVLEKGTVEDAEDRIQTSLQRIGVKSAELHLPVRMPDIVNVKTELRKVDVSEVDYRFRSKLYAFGSSTIESALKEFDKALADKIAENPLD